ncbi:hypothetical protein SDC9_206887 [bioreactor metagenome]|uniref:Uncharacterized protein n=1 Tax=bioreactor metagenome TaxID=1076179 RepID=A0A645J6Z1_9ZZZZ
MLAVGIGGDDAVARTAAHKVVVEAGLEGAALAHVDAMVQDRAAQPGAFGEQAGIGLAAAVIHDNQVGEAGCTQLADQHDELFVWLVGGNQDTRRLLHDDDAPSGPPRPAPD